MSAMRPCSEFSIGISPRSTVPSRMAANASSKVAAATASQCGSASRAARWENEPGSPWKTTRRARLIREVSLMGKMQSRKEFAGPFQIVRSVDGERHLVNPGNLDAHSRFQRAQLLQALAFLQGR